MPISIKDIAKAAGVSPSTVSRALNDHPRISADTKQHIQQLAHEMGYTPSAVARSLVTRRTTSIGLIITTLSDPFYVRLIGGVEDVALKNGYQVFLSSSYRSRTRELDLIRLFQERRADGIIVSGSLVDEDYLELRNRFRLPIVLINRNSYPYSISTDNQEGARQAVDYLIQLGHRRIAYVSNMHSESAHRGRLAGYRASLQTGGIPFDPQLIVDGDGTIGCGSQILEQLFALPRPPTAFFCFNDLMAIGLIDALSKQGFQVPQNYSVVGFDDIEMAQYYNPPLTTVQQPGTRLGQCAIQMLLKLITGQADVRADVLPAELVVRGSTAPPTTN
ncbi:MAG: LacI family DNA-binding transcriptional regulator [Anaerolineae bacterium]